MSDSADNVLLRADGTQHLRSEDGHHTAQRENADRLDQMATPGETQPDLAQVPDQTLSPEDREAWLRNNREQSEDWTDTEILLAMGMGIN